LLLHLLQPLARAWGGLRARPLPGMPAPDRSGDRQGWVDSLHVALAGQRCHVRRGGPHDRHDLSATAGPLLACALAGGAVVLALAFLLAAQTNPNPAFPDWWRLGSLTNEQYRAFHGAWLAKGHPSPLRLLNVAAFFVAFYALLTYLWVPLNRALGWLLIPLGEASLYVFLMHLAFIALIDQIPGYFDESPAWHAVWPVRIWFNTALYVGTILSLWLMVRHKVLFGVVPR